MKATFIVAFIVIYDIIRKTKNLFDVLFLGISGKGISGKTYGTRGFNKKI